MSGLNDLMYQYYLNQVGSGETSLITNSGGVVSDSNSSTSTLTNGSSFTGSWVNADGFDSIIVALKADQHCTIQVQFSPDQTNVDSTLTRYYRTNQIEPPHRFTIARKYARVVVTNDSGSDMTVFRLQTTFGAKTALNAPMDGTLSQDFDATVVRPTVFGYEASLSKRQGTVVWQKWGYNTDVDTGVSEVIWAPGGTPTFLTTASTLDVVSSSVNDDVGGTGATGVVIYGVDANRKSQIEVVFLDGTTTVTTTNTFLGVNRVAVYAAGSLNQNDGTITITATTGGSTQATVPAGEGSTQQCVFFTQDEWSSLITDIFVNVVKLTGGGGNPVATVKLKSRSFVSGATYELMRVSLDTTVENTVNLKLDEPLVITESSVVYLEASTDTNNTEVTGRFTLLEFRDPDATS